MQKNKNHLLQKEGVHQQKKALSIIGANYF
jgi:hypothetical protein